MTSESESESEPLDPFIEKQLLHDIEQTGQHRSDIILLPLCNAKSSVYGEPGTLRRRQVQVRFNNHRRRNLKTWTKILDRFNVSYGSRTRRDISNLQQAQETIAAEETTTADADTATATIEDEDTASVEDEDTATDEDAESVTSALGKFSLGPTPRVNFSSPPRPPAREPEPFVAPTSAQTSRTGGITMRSPQTPRSWNSAGGDTAVVDDSAREGSKTNPYIINVNVAYPECNREFDITFVQGMEHKSYLRDGFHIRKNVSIKDRELWHAKMCHHGEGDESLDAIMVTGPSRDFWMFREEYHRKLTCTPTKHAHAASSNSIMLNADRQISYWKLIFPMDIKLSNVIFSGDQEHIKKEMVGMKCVEGSETYSACVVFWRVADLTVGRLIEAEKETSVADLFSGL